MNQKINYFYFVIFIADRICLGPLSEWICQIKSWMAVSIAFYGVITCSEMIIFSYFYICVWKTVSKINEDFMERFLVLLNVAFSTYISLLFVYSKQYLFTPNYQDCVSMAMKEVFQYDKILPHFKILEMVMYPAGLISLIIQVRMWYMTRYLITNEQNGILHSSATNFDRIARMFSIGLCSWWQTFPTLLLHI